MPEIDGLSTSRRATARRGGAPPKPAESADAALLRSADAVRLLAARQRVSAFKIEVDVGQKSVVQQKAYDAYKTRVLAEFAALDLSSEATSVLNTKDISNFSRNAPRWFAGLEDSPKATVGDGPLHVAARKSKSGDKYLGRAKALFVAGIDLELQNDTGETALVVATKCGSAQMLTLLVDLKTDWHVRAPAGGNLLVTACQAGNVEAFESIISEHLRRSTLSAAAAGRLSGLTCLHLCAGDGRAEKCLPTALQHAAFRAVINERTNSGSVASNAARNDRNVQTAAQELEQTALHKASRNGSLNVLEMLLEAGANPNIVDVKKRSPLMIAAELGYVDLAKALLEHGADARLVDHVGRNVRDILALTAKHAQSNSINALSPGGHRPNVDWVGVRNLLDSPEPEQYPYWNSWWDSATKDCECGA
ncbi:ankyrin repeat-containing domain protein [Pelagophyceae sp. CCMP2097]|nr:ankyrin repeat-containing domain protein [Pelagophyceae sp. CCMP2097]